MSNIMNTIKSKLHGSNHHDDASHHDSSHSSASAADKGKEPTFSIQPHPAKTNDPADLQPSGGLRHGGPMEAHHARDPHVPSEDIMKNMPAPMSHNQLTMRQAELNNVK